MKIHRIPIIALLSLAATAGAVATPYTDEVMADNPVAWWRFDEAAGPTAEDSAGNFDGIFVGGITLQLNSVHPNLGTAAGFDGASAWVDMPALGTFPQSSIEVWLNAGGVAAGCCTSLYSTDSFGAGNLHFNLKPGRDVEHAIAGGSPNNQNTPGGLILDDLWYHVVATYDTLDGGDTRIYVDGVEVLNGAHAGAPPATLVDAQVGAWNNARFFPGMMDELAIYGSVLSPERVLAHFEAATIPEPGTFALLLCGLAALVRRRGLFRR